MQTSKDASANHRDGCSVSQGKRKLSQQQDTPGAGTQASLLFRQSSIPELFLSSKLGKPADDSLPSIKRLKGPNLQPPKMYSMAANSNMIDLTRSSSPSSSPPASSAYVASSSASSGISPVGLRNPLVRPNFQPHTGAKRLVVRNLRQIPRLGPEVYFERIWVQLDGSLTAIFTDNKLPYSLEELYRGVENICRQEQSAALYSKLKERCRAHVATALKNPLLAKMSRGDTELLQSVQRAWKKWYKQLTMIRSIFFYMDRSYLLPSVDASINDMGVSQFRSYIFADTVLREKVLRGMNTLFRYDRDNEIELIDTELLSASISMIQELGIYTAEFEPRFVGSSQSYYAELAESDIQSSDLALYIEASQMRLEKEVARCDFFRLSASTKRDLVSVMEEELIRKNIDVLVDNQKLAKLFNSGDQISLKRLYAMLQRVALEKRLLMPWEAFIKAYGSAIIQEVGREDVMVVRLLDFKKKLDSIWKGPFQKHEELGHGLRESFETFINQKSKDRVWNTNNSKPAEMIAKYVDLLLRSGIKAIPPALSTPHDIDRDRLEGTAGDEDAELSARLDQVLDLFRFIHGKDVFEAFYKKDLARRLLMGRSASADAERTMLSRLRTECGAGFTHNLEQMFKDIDLARDVMTSFKNTRAGHGKDGLDLSVHVLSASAWPTYPDVAVNLPTKIGGYLSAYEAHYRMKHSGRKLAWKHSLAQSVVKASFPKGNKELSVSSFQAIVLLPFNDVEEDVALTYQQIKTASGLSDPELKRTLQSLACGKIRVLTKHPKGRDVNVTDKVSVNLDFHDPKFRIKINQIQLQETKEENKETHERVAQDRQYETQAALVRIMKGRKTITHNELISEVITQTKNRGELDIGEIKTNIEKLIEKDYMERDGQSYKYLA